MRIAERHNFSPYFEGMENPFDQYDSEENLKQYELEQRQRTLERRIRHTKQQVLGYDAAGDKENYERKSALLQKQNEAYNKFCEENGLKKQQDRISIARWNRSEAAKARAAAKKHQKELEKQANFDNMVSELRERKLIPTRSRVNIPPETVYVKRLSFDDHHINKERNHNITREMAEIYIQQSKISLTVWNGQFERYYGTNGAVYVDWLNNSIRTAFSGEEFNEQTIQLLEVLEKYGY